LSNKELVLKKMKALIEKALIVKKKRKPTKATKASKEKRIESKKINADIKKGRKKINIDE
jgi:ribosome-associated protein